MKTLGEIFLKHLGEPLSAEDDSNQSLSGGQGHESHWGCSGWPATEFLCEYPAVFPSGKSSLILCNSDFILTAFAEAMGPAPLGLCQ